jgi:hypothetical protein
MYKLAKHYENLLDDLVAKVFYNGYAVIKLWELLYWYEQERFSIGIRRDIQERWEEWEQGEWEAEYKELVFLRPKGNAGPDVIIMPKKFSVPVDTE